ncbi:MAG: hypothetical protein A3B91_02085 [Candidatus Yanofskybacteria bacterium RIFCSPHIGHO2_02_FULL_41_29]|uniref:Uncharacterized protein n=1 Tax=Candidatus Yanofskybacteria bacterium RIFCSPHIGHO2_01_FULL_41_53 TaxID=1802663 RepID=A0A1F8EFA6_9BACT|nr:MAG: hypothetical protein A2650_01365 [Candidatus Yanofskybacteria bacterium RIFCSPHIGHO2_01_FULL_41_53]OGN10522.1 MAG: hypothetical protein A3B91_02085 [Candidatus Yanofskybacteria bacterium RIFCSPHIGHO2_02_FULL_41_29]OGN21509.1 MAG: hypothetical protein A2916_01715 [Candidatus Yanofskybacteria bacterium RIFCSPLOWO2_01_FULL_41_67]OGN28483.1 MAG: hypothetical protein A3H54_04435 [Candidatus Yanofskybacteria bacterium RIFCSPLOWO2_02_FULL_41_13]
MKRTVLWILALIFSVGIVSPVFAQDGGARRRPPERPSGEQARPRPPQPRPRVVPPPPQRYVPNQRNYQRQYHYNGRWYYQIPRPYQYQYQYRYGYRTFFCQPSYTIFIGYDYFERPLFDFYGGYCNVPGHYHNPYFYYGY